MTFNINGIKVTLLSYSNKGVIILVSHNKIAYRILVTIVNQLKIEVQNDIYIESREESDSWLMDKESI